MKMKRITSIVAMLALTLFASAQQVQSNSGGTNTSVQQSGDNNVAQVTNAAPAKTALQEKAEFDKQRADELAKQAEAAKPKELDNKHPVELDDVKDAQTEERLSRLYVKAQQKQIDLVQLSARVDNAMRGPIADTNAAWADYYAEEAKVAKEHHAEGCNSDPVTKKWKCPPAPAAPAPPAPAQADKPKQ